MGVVVVNNEDVDDVDGRGVEKADVLVDKQQKARTASRKETKVFWDVIVVEIVWIAEANSSSGSSGARSSGMICGCVAAIVVGLMSPCLLLLFRLPR